MLPFGFVDVGDESFYEDDGLRLWKSSQKSKLEFL
jgi:hypothetical protein